jgi:uncharacterized protein YndB with AHSA1/START domain
MYPDILTYASFALDAPADRRHPGGDARGRLVAGQRMAPRGQARPGRRFGPETMTVAAAGMSNHSLSLGRRIAAPVAAVFDAWLDENLIRVWMKPQPDVVLTEVRSNATVGGTFRIVMRANGRDESHEGVYRIIDRPHRLRFSWASVPAGSESRVDISFLPAADDQTMLLLRHERLPSSAAADNHREGWRRILESLARTLEQEG